MAKGGWIKLFRSIQDHWIWENPVYLKWWLDLLLMANHKEQKIPFNGSFKVVGIGERHTSEQKLADRWGVSRNTVRKFLNLLVKDEMIFIEKSRQFGTTYKVVNYAVYQSFEKEEKQRTEQRAEHQEDNELNINKNVKNDKNEKNIYSDPDNKKKSLKNSYGEFKNVMLSDQELEKLKERFTHDWKDRIEKLSYYIESKGKRYKSHYATILSWARKEEQENQVSKYKQINTQLTNKKEIDDLEWDD